MKISTRITRHRNAPVEGALPEPVTPITHIVREKVAVTASPKMKATTKWMANTTRGVVITGVTTLITTGIVEGVDRSLQRAVPRAK